MGSRGGSFIVALATIGLAFAALGLGGGANHTDAMGAIVLTILLLLAAFVLAITRFTVFRVLLLVGAVFLIFSAFEHARTINQEMHTAIKPIFGG